MTDFSYITSAHPSYIENLYKDFVKDPESVDHDMRKFFEGFDFAVGNGRTAKNENGSTVVLPPPVSGNVLSTDVDWMQEIRAYRMILGYRNKGYFIDLSYAHTFVKDVNFPYMLNDKANTFATQTGSRGNIALTVGFKF